jgi:hypothetical protein
MAYSDEDRGRNRRPGAEDRDGRTGRVLGGRAVERSGDAVCSLHLVAPCAVCTWHVETRSVGFLVEPQNQGGGGFLGLGLKTDSSGLVILASKSPRRFLGLDLKIKWASVCWLRHKTDGGRSVRDTHRDIAACFA